MDPLKQLFFPSKSKQEWGRMSGWKNEWREKKVIGVKNEQQMSEWVKKKKPPQQTKDGFM